MKIKEIILCCDESILGYKGNTTVAKEIIPISGWDLNIFHTHPTTQTQLKAIVGYLGK